MKEKKGFTLLEILIVASIIMLLAAAGAISYSSLNRSSRDARRKSDIEQIRAAFEQWRSDGGAYPAPGTDVTVNCNSSGGLVSGSVTYLQTIPKDPQCTTRSYYYVTAANADYVIAAALEIPPSPASCVSLPVSVVGQCDGGGSPIDCNYCVGPYGVR